MGEMKTECFCLRFASKSTVAVSTAGYVSAARFVMPIEDISHIENCNSGMYVHCFNGKSYQVHNHKIEVVKETS